MPAVAAHEVVRDRVGEHAKVNQSYKLFTRAAAARAMEIFPTYVESAFNLSTVPSVL